MLSIPRLFTSGGGLAAKTAIFHQTPTGGGRHRPPQWESEIRESEIRESIIDIRKAYVNLLTASAPTYYESNNL